MFKSYYLVFISLILLSLSGAHAQVNPDTSSSSPAAPVPPAANPIPAELSPAGTATAPASDKAETENLKEQIAAMKAEFDAKLREYDAKLEEFQLNSVQEAGAEETPGVKLSGFFDTGFSKRYPKKSSFSENIIANPLFVLQNFNVILTSQMTDKISFLGEIRFTFLPNGEEAQWSGVTSAAERVDTTTIDPYFQKKYRLGGMAIERVYLQWMPWEFLGVIAGYYLTPFGIWQLDHGSPNRLSVLHPFQVNSMLPSNLRGEPAVPEAQLGVQLLGRVFPMANLFLDYAFTISNGRGPADTVIDYDANKGLGVRLKLTYQRPNIEVALGAYGYYGRYTDKARSMEPERYMQYETVVGYKEYSGTADFLMIVYGVRLQAEFTRNLVYFGEERPYYAILGGYRADYAADAMYGLIGYQLPLDKYLGGMTLTPYFGMAAEYPYDKEVVYFTAEWFGLNFKPSPWITLKTEASRIKCVLMDGLINSPQLWSWNSQLAVSF